MKHTKFVHSFLEDSANLSPNKKALFASDKWHTFKELNDAANQLSHFLVKQGLKRGERVALFLENSMEYVASYYAILKAGGVTVALNTENTADDVDYIAQDCSVHVIITGQKQLAKLTPLLTGESLLGKRTSGPLFKEILLWSDTKTIEINKLQKDIFLLPSEVETEPLTNLDTRLIDLDTASIVYTSGSTGKPRGATLSHLNIVTNTRSIVDYLELTSEDRIMAVLPFYYIYGKSLLNTHFFVGGSVVIDNRFLYPNVILKTMQEQEVTGFAGVPSTFTILLSRSNLKSTKFKTLRYATQAGGALAPAAQKEVAKAFAPAKLFIMYGATEASARLSFLHPSDLPRKWGSIGKAIPNVELFVADEFDNKVGTDEEGEIVARGSNIMSGYWNHPDETQKVIRNGLYHTGDIGKTDEENFIYVVGRSKDMIKIGGNRVSAKEIEDALHEHPAIIEAAVIGIADEVLGEVPKACIVVEPDYTDTISKELPLFLQKHLAAYKIPKYYEIRDSLPKNEAGKIQKLKLR